VALRGKLSTMGRTPLYAWDPDRDPRLACLDEAPFDDEGEDLMLFNGMDLDPGVCINLYQPKKGTLTDFLYSPSLMMYVSVRALEVIQRARTSQLDVHKVVLRDRKGHAVDDSGYFWINVKPIVKLRQDGIPDADLFLDAEGSIQVFTESLVREIERHHLLGATFEDLETFRKGT
jgi:hypothetical protein